MIYDTPLEKKYLLNMTQDSKIRGYKQVTTEPNQKDSQKKKQINDDEEQESYNAQILMSKHHKYEYQDEQEVPQQDIYQYIPQDTFDKKNMYFPNLDLLKNSYKNPDLQNFKIQLNDEEMACYQQESEEKQLSYFKATDYESKKESLFKYKQSKLKFFQDNYQYCTIGKLPYITNPKQDQTYHRQKQLTKIEPLLQKKIDQFYNDKRGFLLQIDFIDNLVQNAKDQIKQVQVCYIISTRGCDPLTKGFEVTKNNGIFFHKKCNINVSKIIKDIVPDPNTFLFIEIKLYDFIHQLPFLQAWTMHELFDYKGAFVNGKFKLPFYSTEQKPGELFKRQLPIFTTIMIYISLKLFAYDNEEINTRLQLQQNRLQKNQEFEQNVANQNEYQVPTLHSKHTFLYQEEKDVLDDRNLYRWKYVDNIQKKYDDLWDYMNPASQQNINLQNKDIITMKDLNYNVNFYSRNQSAGIQRSVTDHYQRTLPQIVENQQEQQVSNVYQKDQQNQQSQVDENKLPENKQEPQNSQQQSIQLSEPQVDLAKIDGLVIRVYDIENTTNRNLYVKCTLISRKQFIKDVHFKQCSNWLLFHRIVQMYSSIYYLDMDYLLQESQDASILLTIYDQSGRQLGWLQSPLFIEVDGKFQLFKQYKRSYLMKPVKKHNGYEVARTIQSSKGQRNPTGLQTDISILFSIQNQCNKEKIELNDQTLYLQNQLMFKNLNHAADQTQRKNFFLKINLLELKNTDKQCSMIPMKVYYHAFVLYESQILLNKSFCDRKGELKIIDKPKSNKMIIQAEILLDLSEYEIIFEFPLPSLLGLVIQFIDDNDQIIGILYHDIVVGKNQLNTGTFNKSLQDQKSKQLGLKIMYQQETREVTKFQIIDILQKIQNQDVVQVQFESLPDDDVIVQIGIISESGSFCLQNSNPYLYSIGQPGEKEFGFIFNFQDIFNYRVQTNQTIYLIFVMVKLNKEGANTNISQFNNSQSQNIIQSNKNLKELTEFEKVAQLYQVICWYYHPFIVDNNNDIKSGEFTEEFYEQPFQSLPFLDYQKASKYKYQFKYNILIFLNENQFSH